MTPVTLYADYTTYAVEIADQQHRCADAGGRAHGCMWWAVRNVSKIRNTLPRRRLGRKRGANNVRNRL